MAEAPPHVAVINPPAIGRRNNETTNIFINFVFQMFCGILFPGVQVPPGIQVPPGVQVPPGRQVPPGVQVPPGRQVPPGVQVHPCAQNVQERDPESGTENDSDDDDNCGHCDEEGVPFTSRGDVKDPLNSYTKIVMDLLLIQFIGNILRDRIIFNGSCDRVRASVAEIIRITEIKFRFCYAQTKIDLVGHAVVDRIRNVCVITFRNCVAAAGESIHKKVIFAMFYTLNIRRFKSEIAQNELFDFNTACENHFNDNGTHGCNIANTEEFRDTLGSKSIQREASYHWMRSFIESWYTHFEIIIGNEMSNALMKLITGQLDILSTNLLAAEAFAEAAADAAAKANAEAASAAEEAASEDDEEVDEADEAAAMQIVP